MRERVWSKIIFTVLFPLLINCIGNKKNSIFENCPTKSKKILENKIEQDYGKLVLNWAGVLDNGEGDEWPHGPYGNFHILTYEADCFCPGNQEEYRKGLSHEILRGPCKREWCDGNESLYFDLEIFKWRNKNDKILLFIYESDPMKGYDLNREHDEVFCKIISRKETLRNNSKLYLSNQTCSSDVIKKFKNNPPHWLKEVWKNKVDKNTPKTFFKFRTIYNPKR